MANTLENLIKSSYGIDDLDFAMHPEDIKRARASLAQAAIEQVGFDAFIQMHHDFLVAKGCSKEHIEEQIERVKDLSSYFDND